MATRCVRTVALADRVPSCPGGWDVATGENTPPTCGIIEVESNQRNYLRTRDLTGSNFLLRFSGLSAADLPTLGAHLHLVPRLRMSGVLPLRRLYAIMAWIGKTLPSFRAFLPGHTDVIGDESFESFHRINSFENAFVIPSKFPIGSKGKAVPVQTSTGPHSSRRLRPPDFKIIGTLRWYCQL